MPKKKPCFVGEKISELDKPYIQKVVCGDLPIDIKVNGKEYCVLHAPNTAKKEHFEIEFQSRLDRNELNFRGVYFPSAIYILNKIFDTSIDFINANFEKSLSFSGVEFKDLVCFNGATFKGDVSFYKVICHSDLQLHAVNFTEDSAFSISDSNLSAELDFSYATFNGYVEISGNAENECFNGERSRMNFQYARLNKPEQIFFHTVRLQPNWFINTDARKFNFTNCVWKTWDGKKIKVSTETAQLEGVDRATILLTKACRQLADNFEENKSFKTASFLRQIGMEAKRVVRYKGFRPWTLHWWYWLSSVYGESWKRAAMVLLTIIFLFSIFYTQTQFQICPNTQPVSMSLSECKESPENCKCKTGGLSIGEGFTHSIATALFQNVEYRKPLTVWGELLTYLEKVIVPLQAALLALAIRRKFMR